jgi:hypothetical protein
VHERRDSADGERALHHRRASPADRHAADGPVPLLGADLENAGPPYLDTVQDGEGDGRVSRRREVRAGAGLGFMC